MKESLKRLIALRKSGGETQETTPTKTSKRNVAPEWIDTLKDNEIFVFGCRNSGRHIDGASAFALEHFGAVMGRREGRQGQSYAIPTIGGTIGLKDIRRSVKQFTQYAAEHPELHFLVTPIGCGGGGWHPQKIAPMFAKASKLPNVSLPQDFWEQLNKSFKIKFAECLEEYHKIFVRRTEKTIRKVLCRSMGHLPARILYRILAADCTLNYFCYDKFDLKERMSLICSRFSFKPDSEEYLLNHKIKRAYTLRSYAGKFQIGMEDIDWDSVRHLPEEVVNRIRNREVKYYSSGIFDEYHNGVVGIMWKVSPNGQTYYLDKYYGGPKTDEKKIVLYGFIDTRYRFVAKMRVVDDSGLDDILNEMRIEAENIVAKSIR